MIDYEMLQIGLALLSPIYGMMLYLTIKSVKFTNALTDCIYCQRSKKIIEKEIENI